MTGWHRRSQHDYNSLTTELDYSHTTAVTTEWNTSRPRGSSSVAGQLHRRLAYYPTFVAWGGGEATGHYLQSLLLLVVME